MKQSHTILPDSHSGHSLATSPKVKAELYKIKAIIRNCHVSIWKSDGLLSVGFFIFSVCIPPKPIHHQKAYFLIYIPDACHILFSLKFWPVLCSALSASCRDRPCAAHSHSHEQDLCTEAHLPESLMRKDSTIIWLHITQQKFVNYDKSTHK